MDFQSVDHGVNITGMQAYIDDINAIVLNQVASVLRNTSDVEAAVRNGWEGEAPEKFIANLNKAKENMVTTLQTLQTAFETELNGIKSEILDMDANLVEEE